ncbi:hypothetical protein J6590_074048 [Homalodisca vitripennis]|nr:hypothetical protein J6590_074048 [Homalodisca vitripennis]
MYNNFLKIATQDYQLLSFVDDVYFKAYSKGFNPSNELLSRKVIANGYIPESYETRQTNEFVKQDCWSLSNMEIYLTLQLISSIVIMNLRKFTSQNLDENIRTITDT